MDGELFGPLGLHGAPATGLGRGGLIGTPSGGSPIPANAMITEDSQVMLTEDGQIMITE